MIRLVLLAFLFSQCTFMSFKGISIPPEANTFYVEDFSSQVSNAPGDANQKFAEALRLKIINESRLKYNEVDPDINFSGALTGFTINAVAPQEGNTTSLNRLEIKFKVNYSNTQNEEEDWTQNFSFFVDFPSSTDLQSEQDGLMETIYRQLTEDVFNKAFTNW